MVVPAEHVRYFLTVVSIPVLVLSLSLFPCLPGRNLDCVTCLIPTIYKLLMDDIDAIPSISSGSVGSRFVSQNELEVAKNRREEQWKAAYARLQLLNYCLLIVLSSQLAHFIRLGQEPPPRPTEDVFDGRSLAEVRPRHTTPNHDFERSSRRFRN